MVTALCAPATMTAQEQCETGKVCKQYLPEKGDFALGVDLIPLFKTIGGSFRSSENVPVGGTPFTYDMMNPKPNVSILGKYMLTDRWALKANLGLIVNSRSNKSYCGDDLGLFLNGDSEAKVVDNRKTTQAGGTLSIGAEYRFGKRRVQGIVGFGIMGGFSTFKTNYTYGNKLTDLNRTPTNSFGNEVTAGVPDGYRITEYRSPGANGVLGAYGSLGAEWFVAPKIALGAEVDLSFYGVFSHKGVAKSEGYNEAYEKITTRTDLLTPGDNTISFGTDNIGAALYISFYFK